MLSFPSSILTCKFWRLFMILLNFVSCACMLSIQSCYLRVYVCQQLQLKPTFGISPTTYEKIENNYWISVLRTFERKKKPLTVAPSWCQFVFHKELSPRNKRRLHVKGLKNTFLKRVIKNGVKYIVTVYRSESENGATARLHRLSGYISQSIWWKLGLAFGLYRLFGSVYLGFKIFRF